MDIEFGGAFDAALRGDVDDLFAACLRLGRDVEEYDIDREEVVTRFRRDDEWREALTAIRRLLKKHHAHAELPMRACLAKWRVLRDKLLPMLTRFHGDRDFLYNLGKVLVFMTAPPPGIAAPSTLAAGAGRGTRARIAAEQLSYLQDIKFAIVRGCPAFLPACMTLLAPVLDPARERSDGDVNAVDLVLTLLKQLAEIPDDAPLSGASAGANTHHGLSAAFLLALHEAEVFSVAADFCRLLDRREFRRLAPVLLDFWYNIFKHVSEPEDLHKALAVTGGGVGAPLPPHRQALVDAAVNRESTRVAAAAHPRGDSPGVVDAGAGAGAGAGVGAAMGAGSAAIPRPARALVATLPAQFDPLRAALGAERSVLAAARAASSQGRHSRFGSTFEVRRFGQRALTSSLAAVFSDTAGCASGADARFAQTGRSKGARAGGKNELFVAMPELGAGSALDALGGGAGPGSLRVAAAAAASAAAAQAAKDVAALTGGASGSMFADVEYRATAMLAALARDLMTSELPALPPPVKRALVVAASEDDDDSDDSDFVDEEAAAAAAAAKEEEGAAAGSGEEEGGGKVVEGAAAEVEATAAAAAAAAAAVAAAAEEEEEEEEPQATSPFSALSGAIKSRLVRDSDDMTPADRLRYLFLATTLMAAYRGASNAAAKSWEEDTRRQRASGVVGKAPSGASPGEGEGAVALRASSPLFDASPCLECLDSWSFRAVLALIEESTVQRHWQALAVAGTHLIELILLVHTMLERGDEESADIGAQLYDAVFRERERSDMLPKLLRTVSEHASALPARFGPLLVEGSHYLLKMAERAGREHLRVKGGRKHALGSGVKEKLEAGAAAAAAIVEGGDGEEAVAALEEAAREAAAAARAALRAAASPGGSSKERVFEFQRFAAEFLHPGVIAAYVAVLRRYATNTPRLNYFATQALTRFAALPNEYAGTHPGTGEALTFRYALYSTDVLFLASDILNDVTTERVRALHNVREWAKGWAADFLRDTSSNPLLFVEALFVRPEKGVNAELARHYGALGEGGAHGGGGGGGGKRRSKLAQAADAAEAEAARNRELRLAGEEGAEGLEMMELDYDDLGRGGRGSSKKQRRRRKQPLGVQEVRRDASSSDASSADSASSAPDVADAAAAPPKRRLARKKVASSSSEGDGGGAPAKGAGAAAGARAAARVLDEDEDEDLDGGAGAAIAQPQVHAAAAASVEGALETSLAAAAAAWSEVGEAPASSDEDEEGGMVGAARDSTIVPFLQWLAGLLQRASVRRGAWEKGHGGAPTPTAALPRLALFPATSNQSLWLAAPSLAPLFTAAGCARTGGGGVAAWAIDASASSSTLSHSAHALLAFASGLTSV